MSLKKRLILSNIAMVVVPILSLILIELLLSMFLIYVFDMKQDENLMKIFKVVRFTIFFLILIVTNGLLAYFISKSILNPILSLSNAAQEISKGNLDFKIEPMNKDELGKLSETFEKMRQELKKSAELQMKYEDNRNELISHISHDLKTPITSIKGYIEGILDGVANTPEKMDRYIQTIYTKAIDMDHLIDELFLYSKLDLSKVPFHFEQVKMNTYFSELIEELQFDLAKEGVIITLELLVDNSITVTVDSDQLKRVVMNIIQNSLKYMDKEEKYIRVVLLDKQNFIQVHIQDNGKGISKEALPNIFDRFYRADVARNTTTGGSGLGLAIAKRIVEEHGGEVWAESVWKVGTSIYFTLKKDLNKGVVE